ncbi:conserved protein of unknown function [Tepidanaerobacter acetatoxydans Re1]|uniref:Uncharacterized protein n=1 Tax=Tepidanaerobacter acetatoxydans (strain DSM 21804 / JCM 16047 / Re1) TaxID=1209989 RepID=F4LW01_TEPAE|nr:hypothetical protein TepRe1_1523 [Tepidanaerobacter acetatoxydans Re1]CCP26415.1 conserved protein of unknown function [Tepidanaerobacter acetatoxydans Re1]
MEENDDRGFGNDLLETVLKVINGPNDQSANELISLLALSNLLGIISFLNAQDSKSDTRGFSSKSEVSELKEMAADLLDSMGGTGDKKINPAALINLMKTFSTSDGSANNSKNLAKSDEIKKD